MSGNKVGSKTARFQRPDNGSMRESVEVGAEREADEMLHNSERQRPEDELRMAYKELELRIREKTSELHRANEQIRKFAAHLQSVREDERTRIAREIHDELGQMLIAHKLQLSWFRDNYADHGAVLEKVNAMIETVNSTVEAVRRMYTELRPTLLDDFGLVEAMQWQANEFKKLTGIEYTFGAEPWDMKLDKERSTVLFRIFQEALTNVSKHSNATMVMIKLTQDDGSIVLEVTDNGKGLTDEEIIKPQSFGLMEIRERVHSWGGTVNIASKKGVSTTVTVIMPQAV